MEQKLKTIFARVFDCDLVLINDETSQNNLKTWDSMNHLLLISEIESEFKISIPLDKTVSIKSFKDAKKILREIQNEPTF